MCHYCLKDHHSTCALLKTTNFDPGGFAEFVRIPAVNVTNGTFKLPSSMGYEEAVFIEPLGCVFRGQRRAGLHAGDTVVVLGSGLTGLLHIRLAKALGAGMVLASDVLESRLQAASDCGADECCMAEDDLVTRLRSCNDGKLADVVIVATGAPPALKQAFDLVDAGGTILFFAPSAPDFELPMPFNRLWADEVSMVTTYAASPKDIKVAIELIRTGRVPVKDLISHRLPLSQIQEGFGLVANPVDSLKVIIEPQR
jgi:L-iditol 2-dehydrogenase